MNRWYAVLWAGVGGVVLMTAGCSVARLDQARKLAQVSEPFTVRPPAATARLLVVGDSTGVGTGASTARHSLAGRIAAEHPHLEIINRAEDGARFADVVRQLDAAPATRFDMVLIQAGGNDVIRFTGADTLRAQIDEALRLAGAKATMVIVMPSGNVGNAPFFFAPLSWIMTSRSRGLHAMVRASAAASGAVYVNLFNEAADDPFVREPQRLHAADGLHPSDEGYALWYAELRSQAALSDKLP
ncbi:MAG: GDSL-type esterase/lipase family protein [Roseiflexaceae bacterium]